MKRYLYIALLSLIGLMLRAEVPSPKHENKGGLAYDHLWTRLATEACDDRVRTEDATTGIMPDTGSFERS